VEVQRAKEAGMGGAGGGKPWLGGNTARRAAAARQAETRDWRSDAACRGVSAPFHQDLQPAHVHRISRAKAVCATCPVRPQCAAYALAAEEPHGVWGGFTARERELLLGTQWRDCADRQGARVDVAGLQARLDAIRVTVAHRAV
jgi:WhiB family transcriptional regulator, redox-sensing transcriptional regulator